jgi:predicted transcriptional regulator
MNLLAFDTNHGDPRERLADYIVESDEKLLRDLVAFRKMRGMSQQDVADRMGIAKSNVSRLESGTRDLQQSTLRRYAMAIDAVVQHGVLAFEVVDNGTKARNYSETAGRMTRNTPEVVTSPANRAVTYA